MLSVALFIVMLSIIILSVIMLNVVRYAECRGATLTVALS
jgi:hypothetical protein